MLPNMAGFEHMLHIQPIFTPPIEDASPDPKEFKSATTAESIPKLLFKPVAAFTP